MIYWNKEDISLLLFAQDIYHVRDVVYQGILRTFNVIILRAEDEQTRICSGEIHF